MKKILLVCFFFSSLVSADEVISKIACGSCFKVSYDKGIWKTITAEKPQLFLFMGDNVYADTEDMEKMKATYQALLDLPAYSDFSKSVPILPTWDDHDYGKNDAGNEYPMKEKSAEIFFDAFNFPNDHPARKTPGVYHSRSYGPDGKRIQIILLDTRSFRSPLKSEQINRRKTYVPVKGDDVTMLGKAQWQWLELELKKPADLRLIVSSIQILATKHRFEKWSNIPNERQKFLKLLREVNPVPTVLLSGDRHLAEVNRLPKEESGLGYPLYELTSSGMSHAGAGFADDPLHVRGTYTNKINYGLIKIDWAGKKPKLSLNIKNLDGSDASTTEVSFD